MIIIIIPQKYISHENHNNKNFFFNIIIITITLIIIYYNCFIYHIEIILKLFFFKLYSNYDFRIYIIIINIKRKN